MTAFEFYVNGEKVRTIGVACGTIGLRVGWAVGGYGGYSPEPRVAFCAVDGVAGAQVWWPSCPLRPGDEITIRVADVEAADPPELTCETDRILRWDMTTGLPLNNRWETDHD